MSGPSKPRIATGRPKGVAKREAAGRPVRGANRPRPAVASVPQATRSGRCEIRGRGRSGAEEACPPRASSLTPVPARPAAGASAGRRTGPVPCLVTTVTRTGGSSGDSGTSCCQFSKCPPCELAGKVRGRTGRTKREPKFRDWLSVAGVDTSRGAASVGSSRFLAVVATHASGENNTFCSGGVNGEGCDTALPQVIRPNSHGFK